MLRFFAKLERSRNLVLLAFCVVLLIGLVAFYIPDTSIVPGGRAGSPDDGVVVAKVGSQEITLKEYRNALAQMAATFGRGQVLPPATLKALGMDKQVLDQLIANRIVLDQAGEFNLVGTDREVNDVIKRMYSDAEGKFIGKEEYVRRLRLQGFDVSEYEQDRRDEITTRKVRSFLTSAELVSDREVEEKFKKDNTKIDLVYGALDLDKVRSKLTLSEAELRSYYDGHKDEFKASEPVRKVEYIFIPTDEVAKTVSVPDEELMKQYESNKQFEYRVSVIKRNVLATADENTVRTKIEEIAKRARGGPNAPAEDFATLAKGESQDTATASKGGDLGWIKKEPNKTGDWKQRPYTNGLKVGDIDGPFRDGASWYLMKITEQREVPFAQMKPTLLATAKNNKAFIEASKLADEAYEKAVEAKDLRKGAEAIAAKLKMSVDAMIKATPYFKNGDAMKDLGKGSGIANNPAFDDATSSLKKDEIGDKVSIPGGYAVPKVVDIIDKGAQLTFEQASNMVEDKVRKEREPNLAKSRAQDLVNQAKDAADLERLMKAEGIDVKRDTNFNTYTFPGAAAGGLQAQNQARSAMMTLKDGEVSKTPVKVGASYLIFAATKRTEPDLSKLPAEREGIRQGIIAERQNAAYEAFVKTARKRYEDEKKITVYQDRIDKFFTSASAAQQ